MPLRAKNNNKLRVYKFCWHRSYQLRFEVRNWGAFLWEDLDQVCDL